jgi:predicted HTH transcriptional regulator
MDELDRIIAGRRETLAVELKRRMSWLDPVTKGKVLKAVLALSNLRDGGVLLFGLDRSGGDDYQLNGLTVEDAAQYTTDDVAAFVNAYADPNINLTVEKRVLDGHNIVAIVVREFAETPVVCVRDYVVEGKPVVRRGRMYCRSRRMIESAEVQEVEDLRAILDLATEKGLHRYFQLRSIERKFGGDDSSKAFDAQLGGL